MNLTYYVAMDYIYKHMSNFKVLLIYMHSKKQAGKPRKRANALCVIKINFCFKKKSFKFLKFCLTNIFNHATPLVYFFYLSIFIAKGKCKITIVPDRKAKTLLAIINDVVE